MKRARLVSWLPEVFRGDSQGFTYIEVLITIALIGAISIAFFSFMSAATSALIRADERTIAENLARSQLEYVRNQGYNSTLVNGHARYEKIPPESIPSGYQICSVTRNGTRAHCGPHDPVIGIPWNSGNNTPAASNTGIQKIALVVMHKDKNNQDKPIYIFVNNNPNWANKVPITLEGYVGESVR